MIWTAFFCAQVLFSSWYLPPAVAEIELTTLPPLAAFTSAFRGASAGAGPLSRASGMVAA